MAPRWGGLRPEPYDPDARDADGDGIVQEQTAWERPVGTNLVDELGRAITRGSNVGARPRGMRVVDSSGNDVDYTPTYARPGAAPGAERVGGATALADHGAGSLKERGLPTVRAAAAPRVLEPEVAPEQIAQADAPSLGPDPDKPKSPTESKPKLTSPEAIKADIKPGTEDDLVGEKSLEVGNELTEKILASREEADQSWRDVTVVARDGQTVEIRRDASPDDGMPIIDVMGAEAPDIKMQNAREVGRLLSEDLSLEEMQGFLPESVEVTISKNGIVRLVSTKDVPPGQEQIQILVNTPTEANYREAIRRGDIIVVDPTTDDYKGLLAEGIASKLIEGWATMEGAEELHRSAERVFGAVDPMRSQVDEDPARQKVIDAMMMATYKNTQRQFKEQGITEIVLHRGMRLTPKDSPLGEYIYSKKSPDVTEFQEELDISLRPLSSFSYNLDTARYSFGEYGAPGGTVMTSTIPVERIISTATTAFGCREEDEIMVIGGGNISTTLRWTLERKSTGLM